RRLSPVVDHLDGFGVLRRVVLLPLLVEVADGDGTVADARRHIAGRLIDRLLRRRRRAGQEHHGRDKGEDFAHKSDHKVIERFPRSCSPGTCGTGNRWPRRALPTWSAGPGSAPPSLPVPRAPARHRAGTPP